MGMLEDIGTVFRKMSHAAMRVGREPDAALLVAVSKTVPVERMRESIDLGLRVFGESRVQEAEVKARALADMGLTWHMVGHLQRNKAKAAVGLFELIHSVDSVELLRAIDRHAAAIGKTQRVLIEIKLAPEETKSGVDEAGLREILEAAGQLINVKVEGLMAVPPYIENPAEVKPYFRRLRELGAKYGLKQLSMGMSHDYEAAIEEGATIVRVGTAIFGSR